MENEIIPPEKYVEKALIDQIFSSTVGIHSQTHKEMPRYFKILQKNLMDTITIKEPKEEEKNKQRKNRNLQIKLSRNYDNWNKMLKYRSSSTNRKANYGTTKYVENGTYTINETYDLSTIFTGSGLDNYYLGIAWFMNLANQGTGAGTAHGTISNVRAEVI